MRARIYHNILKKVMAVALLPFYLFTFLLFPVSCSMTKNIPEDDQLFTGLTGITYVDEPKDDPFEDHLDATKEEVEVALATPPTAHSSAAAITAVPGPGGCGSTTNTPTKTLRSPVG